MDIISDLHIDQWDINIGIKYPHGNITHSPIEIKPQSDILIVAGDISDDLQLTINYLDDISKYYKKVLFVDGNHEHVNKYPELYSTDYIYSQIKDLGNDKIIYLTKESYKYKDYVIIGCNGWWDYNEGVNKDYFKNWMTHIDNDIFVKNVLDRAKEEYDNLKLLTDLHKKVIIVTHTPPYPILNINLSTKMNSMMNNLISSKVPIWIFGHIHHKYRKKINNTLLISNPRGRPDDADMNEYSINKLNNL